MAKEWVSQTVTTLLKIKSHQGLNDLFYNKEIKVVTRPSQPLLIIL